MGNRSERIWGRVRRIGERIKRWAKAIKRDVLTVYFAIRDPQIPRGLRVFAIAVIAYAVSPIDLIPDFIPVLGYLDDLILVPLGVWLILRWLPPDVLARAKAQAAAAANQRVRSNARWVGAAMVVAAWIAVAAIAYITFVR
jgi:uncharacterized membrane protein YkvA (DUF1232 family)